MKKGLLDIQKALRELESKVRDISVSIAEIYEELDAFRNDEADSIDYEKIRFMSLHFSFGRHPLSRLEDAYGCRRYLEALLSLTRVDPGSERTVNRLSFIQWIQSQSGLDISLEDLFKESLQINTESFGELAEIIPSSYRRQLVMDALITANICGSANDEVLRYVANLCSILGVDKEQLRILSLMAKGVLKQELGKLQETDLQQVLTQAKAFEHYLNHDLMDAVLCAQRTVAVEVPDRSWGNFVWKVKQRGRVKEGDIIATHRVSFSGKVSMIKAPCAGTLFQFRNNCINYGVIAHESDNKDAIKAWTLQRR